MDYFRFYNNIFSTDPFCSVWCHAVSVFEREGYCSCLVCVCVYLSVPALAASASVETSNQRYSRVSLRLFLDFDSGFLKKSSVQKLWREKANMQMS